MAFPAFGIYIGLMTEEWNEQLRCPHCRKRDIASLSQARTHASTVLSVPDGFKIAQTEYGPDFQCATCGTAVDP